MPRPESACTVMLFGLAPVPAAERLNRALGSRHEVSGAAYLPTSLAVVQSPLRGVAGVAALRLEGPAPSVAFRRERVLAELAGDGESAVLEADPSATFWRSIRDAAALAELRDRVVWRISVAPSRGATLGEAISRTLEADWYLDWGGGLLWVAIAGAA